MNAYNKKELDSIRELVRKDADALREGAAYGGRMDDGGAGEAEAILHAWLDGISYAETGETSLYSKHLKRVRATGGDVDRAYKEYLRLKKIFE